MDEEEKTTIEGEKPKRRRATKKKPSGVSVTEEYARKTTFHTFRIFRNMINSKTEMEENRFKVLGKSLSDFSSQFPFITMLLKILSILVVAGEAADITREVWAGRPERPKKQDPNVYDMPNDAYTEMSE